MGALMQTGIALNKPFLCQWSQVPLFFCQSERSYYLRPINSSSKAVLKEHLKVNPQWRAGCPHAFALLCSILWPELPQHSSAILQAGFSLKTRSRFLHCFLATEGFSFGHHLPVQVQILWVLPTLYQQRGHTERGRGLEGWARGKTLLQIFQ